MQVIVCEMTSKFEPPDSKNSNATHSRLVDPENVIITCTVYYTQQVSARRLVISVIYTWLERCTPHH